MLSKVSILAFGVRLCCPGQTQVGYSAGHLHDKLVKACKGYVLMGEYKGAADHVETMSIHPFTGDLQIDAHIMPEQYFLSA